MEISCYEDQNNKFSESKMNQIKKIEREKREIIIEREKYETKNVKEDENEIKILEEVTDN